MVNNDAAIHLLEDAKRDARFKDFASKSSFSIVKHLLSLCIEARIPLSNLVVSGNATEAQQAAVLWMTPDSAGCFVFKEGTTKGARLFRTDFVKSQHAHTSS